MEVCNEIHAAFVPANTSSIMQPMEQGVILTSKSFLKNAFCKVLAAIDTDSTGGSGQNHLKTLRKDSPF